MRRKTKDTIIPPRITLMKVMLLNERSSGSSAPISGKVSSEERMTKLAK